MRSTRRKLAVIGLLVAAGLFLANTNWLATRSEGGPTLLAHRGLHQTFPSDGLENDICTASRIRAPTHRYLENTLASMRAAFDAGATIVEFDVHPTTDGHFAVFHDWTVDCRTNGTGVTREKSLAELQSLDVGYGYTADGGQTFPFRGDGVGLMPTLDDVLQTFPDKRFLINVKSRDPDEGRKLAHRLGKLTEQERARLTVYGHDIPLSALREERPDVRLVSRGTLMRCLLRYLGAGWSGYVPAACRNTMVLVPENYAWLLWGWPNRFVNRMQSVGTDVYVVGPYDGRDFSTGIDTPEDLARLPASYSGGIWTNRIDVIAPLLRR
ncbi:MAG TPA: glycerophosphodiester phosphodiesterase family protein [Hyphomicrobium sp.]|nr:glycerophosphodiester phosphodiesterase family protein [Hyphomicrobium sp.]HRO50055.1 glycerophosphodiester phosphodiesterase family protein [Hyphomicrobium sp.]